AQTSLQGKVTDKDSGEPILFASIILQKNGVYVTEAQTDLNGNYAITNIDPGTYEVKASFISHATRLIKGVVVKSGKTNVLDIQMTSKEVSLSEIVVTEYKAPLIDPDENTQGKTITSENIQNLPVKSVGALAATTAGVTRSANGTINIR